MKRDSGFTLVEVLIVSLLVAGLAYFAATVLTHSNKEGVRISKQSRLGSALNLLGEKFQKYIASDLHFYGFFGATAQEVGRLIIPVPGRCADLSECRESTALLYVHYDRSSAAGMTGLCMWDDSTLILDASNTDFGQVGAPNAQGFPIASANPGIPSGFLRVEQNSILAFVSPPKAMLFTSQDAAQAFPLTHEVAVNQWKVSGVVVVPPPECVLALSRNGVVRSPIGTLYRVPVAPLTLARFTGVPVGDISGARLLVRDGFPHKIINASIRSLGRRKVAPGNFAMIPCTVQGGAIPETDFVCSGRPLLDLWNENDFMNIKQVRIDGSYSAALGNAVYDRYEWISDAMVRTPSCAAAVAACAPGPVCTHPGACAVLEVPARMKRAVTAAERFDNLNSTELSFMKQEVLSGLRFRLLGTDDKEGFFDILMSR